VLSGGISFPPALMRWRRGACIIYIDVNWSRPLATLVTDEATF